MDRDGCSTAPCWPACASSSCPSPPISGSSCTTWNSAAARVRVTLDTPRRLAGRRHPRRPRPGQPAGLAASSTPTTRSRVTTRWRSPVPGWSGRCAPRRTSVARSARSSPSGSRTSATTSAGSPARWSPPTTRRRPSPSTVPTGPVERTVAYDQIDRAKTVFEWGAAPKPGSGPSARRRSIVVSNLDMTEAIRLLAQEKGLSEDSLLHVLVDALASAYKRRPGAADEVVVEVDPETMEFTFTAYDLDEDGNWVNERDDTPAARRARPHRRPDVPPGDEPAHPRGRAGPQVRGVRQPRGRHRHRHHPADRHPLHAARPRARRGAAAAGRAGAVRAPAAGRPLQGLHRRGPQDGQGPADRRQPHPPRPDQAALRARGAGDRRRHRRDQGLRPRARAPHEDRRVVERPQRRSRRRVRRRPRRPRPHGRQRAARREDRHRPVQRGLQRLRRQGAVAGEGRRRSSSATTARRPT